MEYNKRFSATTCNHAINISEIQKNKPYPIMNAVRNTTKFGQSIAITIKDDSNNTFRVFLSKIYLIVLTDEGINDINKEKIKLLIVSQGKYDRTEAYALSLTYVCVCLCVVFKNMID